MSCWIDYGFLAFSQPLLLESVGLFTFKHIHFVFQYHVPTEANYGEPKSFTMLEAYDLIRDTLTLKESGELRNKRI